jgi:hypothetical protein
VQGVLPPELPPELPPNPPEPPFEPPDPPPPELPELEPEVPPPPEDDAVASGPLAKPEPPPELPQLAVSATSPATIATATQNAFIVALVYSRGPLVHGGKDGARRRSDVVVDRARSDRDP